MSIQSWTIELPDKATDKWKNMTDQEQYNLYREQVQLYQELREEYEKADARQEQHEKAEKDLLKLAFVPRAGVLLSGSLGAEFIVDPLNLHFAYSVGVSAPIFINKKGVTRWFVAPGVMYTSGFDHGIYIKSEIGVIF
jgi:hypothetical protein